MTNAAHSQTAQTAHTVHAVHAEQAYRGAADAEQLALYGLTPDEADVQDARRHETGVRSVRKAMVPGALGLNGRPARQPRLCAACQAKEARYGFRPEGVQAATTDRPSTLCFECFRSEIDRRQRLAALMARGWNAQQASLPLEDTLNELSLRRRRAQIAARHALGI